ncbi:GtrA family protein [Sphingomonas canadensis]|uniref:GtrA family protein n=1 Tax=Sphingomonas canadensis TaxID=1219257 RepID=A0ABW3H2R4_9SPHN
MAFLIERIQAMRASGMLDQLVRFGIAGGISTVIYSAVYLPLAYYVFQGPQAVWAVPPAFLVAVACGFPLHSKWSFKGHGTRDNSGRQHLKFVVVQAFGMLLTATFTWILTKWLHMPEWVPLIPAIFVTPLATFGLNRMWVFG